MPEIPICVALVQTNHDYGLVESFPNMNSSQQTLDLTHLSILFRSVAEATIEYARKSVWFFGKWAWLLNFSRALCARSFNRTPLREVLDPPLRTQLYVQSQPSSSSYEDRTTSSRHNLLTTFKGYSFPFESLTSQYCQQQIAGWLTEELLHDADIDTDTFKADSTRSTASAAAKCACMSMADLLKLAGRTRTSTFERFYQSLSWIKMKLLFLIARVSL